MVEQKESMSAKVTGWLEWKSLMLSKNLAPTYPTWLNDFQIPIHAYIYKKKRKISFSINSNTFSKECRKGNHHYLEKILTERVRRWWMGWRSTMWQLVLHFYYSLLHHVAYHKVGTKWQFTICKTAFHGFLDQEGKLLKMYILC